MKEETYIDLNGITKSSYDWVCSEMLGENAASRDICEKLIETLDVLYNGKPRKCEQVELTVTLLRLANALVYSDNIDLNKWIQVKCK